MEEQIILVCEHCKKRFKMDALNTYSKDGKDFCSKICKNMYSILEDIPENEPKKGKGMSL